MTKSEFEAEYLQARIEWHRDYSEKARQRSMRLDREAERAGIWIDLIDLDDEARKIAGATAGLQ